MQKQIATCYIHYLAPVLKQQAQKRYLSSIEHLESTPNPVSDRYIATVHYCPHKECPVHFTHSSKIKAVLQTLKGLYHGTLYHQSQLQAHTVYGNNLLPTIYNDHLL